ncbi:hypothetical protein [Profundibacterium mesophilum]|uniref:Uncharacterized protein n=1 Tax=Profundibacterium mesophilum KAUST100406-0324 TaxID=1037889 RepID=A0A921TCM0_9RHOB|nr:hypothetical protein [Profundibacterium mesophilum]KAF0675057.1 hypothetical protein PMES_02578 [Profundibacterium mesophilum KAUST100406-0324]
MIRVYIAAGASLALVLAFLGYGWWSRAAERDAEALRRLERYQQTRERIDNATSPDLDGAAIRERLRELAR